MLRVLLFSMLAVGVAGCATRFVEPYFTDVNGLPTYEARQRVEPWEEPDAKAIALMLHYCPDGNPELVRATVWTWELSGREVHVVFTCNHLIEDD